MRKTNETLGRNVPNNGRRACLCKDGKTYSRKCCDGTLRAQGIGRITAEAPKTYMFRAKNCDNNHQHNIWSDTINLTVGKIYYLVLANQHHTACYEILRTTTEVGLEISTASIAYDDCSTCQSAN